MNKLTNDLTRFIQDYRTLESDIASQPFSRDNRQKVIDFLFTSISEIQEKNFKDLVAQANVNTKLNELATVVLELEAKKELDANDFRALHNSINALATEIIGAESLALLSSIHAKELQKDKEDSGKLKCTLEGGAQYEGLMKDGLPNDDVGVISWPDREYRGQVHNGRAHGVGTLAYQDGRIQEGLWENGKFTEEKAEKANELKMRTGFNLVVERQKDVTLPREIYRKSYRNHTYFGEFSEGVPNGIGKMFGPGETYIGWWRNGAIERGIKHNHMLLTTYIGEFKNFSPHGRGKMTYRNGNQFEGTWVNGEPQDGFLRFEDGRVFVGKTTRGDPWGMGRLTYPNGDWVEGDLTIVNDKLYASEANMRKTESDGTIYEGNCKMTIDGNLVSHGRGVLISSAGERIEGTWELGELMYRKGDWKSDTDPNIPLSKQLFDSKIENLDSLPAIESLFKLWKNIYSKELKVFLEFDPKMYADGSAQIEMQKQIQEFSKILDGNRYAPFAIYINPLQALLTKLRMAFDLSISSEELFKIEMDIVDIQFSLRADLENPAYSTCYHLMTYLSNSIEKIRQLKNKLTPPSTSDYALE